MKRGLKNILIFISIGWIGYSCNTDFELNAPYQSIPIVYGLLDQSADTQFIKINKSFIGDGNNVDYASINDSVLFNSISAKVEDVQTGSFYDLQELWVNNLDDGLFYNDSQKVYYFVPNSDFFDNEDHTFRLTIETAEVGQSITAETILIDSDGLDFDYLFKQILGNNGVRFADNNTPFNGNYQQEQIKWKTSKNGKIYDLLLRFKYIEHRTNGTSEVKYINWKLGSQTSVNIDGFDPMFKNVSGEAFFQMLQANLNGYEHELEVEKREIRGVELIVSAGTEDLNAYMEVNEPVTGVVTERPSFTNINGGIGIFSSKNSVKLPNVGWAWYNSYKGYVPFSFWTIYEICKGQYTEEYKFCTDSTNAAVTILSETGENCACN